MALLTMLLLLLPPGPVAPPSGAETGVRTNMGAPPGGPLRLRGVAVGDGDRDGASGVYFTPGPGG